jgi:protease-4
VAAIVAALVLLVLVFAASGLGAYTATFLTGGTGGAGGASDSSYASSGAARPDSGNCNVTGIEIHGCIYTYGDKGSADYSANCDTVTSSEDVVAYIEQAEKDDSVKAILLDVDSPGGMPQAALEIAQALKTAHKPSVAWIRGYGDSAAYWVSSAATTIIASRESDVGSIGVTSSYTDNAAQNTKEGLTYNSLSTGKYKDTGSPDKPLTADERAYIEKSLQVSLQDFIESVATNRHLPIEKVRALADGSSMLGQEALDNGLIDKLGAKNEVWADLEAKAGDKPEVCWPQYQ